MRSYLKAVWFLLGAIVTGYACYAWFSDFNWGELPRSIVYYPWDHASFAFFGIVAVLLLRRAILEYLGGRLQKPGVKPLLIEIVSYGLILPIATVYVQSMYLTDLARYLSFNIVSEFDYLSFWALIPVAGGMFVVAVSDIFTYMRQHDNPLTKRAQQAFLTS
jgi:hypothetical protein